MPTVDSVRGLRRPLGTEAADGPLAFNHFADDVLPHLALPPVTRVGMIDSTLAVNTAGPLRRAPSASVVGLTGDPTDSFDVSEALAAVPGGRTWQFKVTGSLWLASTAPGGSARIRVGLAVANFTVGPSVVNMGPNTGLPAAFDVGVTSGALAASTPVEMDSGWVTATLFPGNYCLAVGIPSGTAALAASARAYVRAKLTSRLV